MKKLLILLVASLLPISSFSLAGEFGDYPAYEIASDKINKSDTQTRAYAGLAWVLGVKKTSFIPDLVVGIRSLKVKSNDDVSNGVDLSARLTFGNGFAFDSTRLSYVGGNRDLLGNIGIGYSMTNNSFLTTIAAQGPYSRIGGDYEFSNSRINPYLELLTAEKPDNVKSKSTKTFGCNSGDILDGSFCFIPTAPV